MGAVFHEENKNRLCMNKQSCFQLIIIRETFISAFSVTGIQLG